MSCLFASSGMLNAQKEENKNVYYGKRTINLSSLAQSPACLLSWIVAVMQAATEWEIKCVYFHGFVFFTFTLTLVSVTYLYGILYMHKILIHTDIHFYTTRMCKVLCISPPYNILLHTYVYCRHIYTHADTNTYLYYTYGAREAMQRLKKWWKSKDEEKNV